MNISELIKNSGRKDRMKLHVRMHMKKTISTFSMILFLRFKKTRVLFLYFGTTQEKNKKMKYIKSTFILALNANNPKYDPFHATKVNAMIPNVFENEYPLS